MVEKPTPQLRFIHRGEEKVLQQRWELLFSCREIATNEPSYYAEYEWRDIPIFPFDPGQNS